MKMCNKLKEKIEFTKIIIVSDIIKLNDENGGCILYNKISEFFDKYDKIKIDFNNISYNEVFFRSFVNNFLNNYSLVHIDNIIFLNIGDSNNKLLVKCIYDYEKCKLNN